MALDYVAAEPALRLQRSAAAMTSAAPPRVIGLGELLWDDFPDGRRPGGAPANFAFQANQLGCHGQVVTRVGVDSSGDELLAELSAKGLDLSAVQRDADHPTGRVSVTLDAHGHPQYVIHAGAAWDFLQQDAALEVALRAASAVCFGTLAQRSPASRAAIQAAVRLVPAGALRVYDVNLRQNYYAREWIEASLRHADIVKLNDEEVAILSGLLELPGDEAAFGKQLIADFGPRLVCVTRGARGCLLVSADAVHDIPGRAVKVADTVGAGDAFTAGLVASQLRGWPLPLCGEFANRVGGLVASRPGAMPDLKREFAQLLAQYQPAEG
jgi:fructokinase